MNILKTRNIISYMLFPLGLVYLLLSKLRQLITVPYVASVPVICVGNITMGGTGKTPVCQQIIKSLNKQKIKVVVVSRGYGGDIVQPTLIDNKIHTAKNAGDEPLLLATECAVVVSKSKKAGVKYAEKLGAEIILLDDGLQNPTVKKTKTVVVVDGYTGFGNGFILPAGNLREYARGRLQQADAIIITGTKGDIYEKLKQQYTRKSLLWRI